MLVQLTPACSSVWLKVRRLLVYVKNPPPSLQRSKCVLRAKEGVLDLGARSCNLYIISLYLFPFIVLLELLEEALRAGGHAR